MNMMTIGVWMIWISVLGGIALEYWALFEQEIPTPSVLWDVDTQALVLPAKSVQVETRPSFSP
jgi:hypothetical protein